MKYALRTRLAAGLAISFVMLAGLQWLLAGIAIERLLKAQLAQRLERDAENLLAALDGEAGASLQLDDARVGGEYRQPFSGHYFRIVIDGGDDISSRSLWDHSLALPAAGSERIAQSEAAGPQGQSLWLLSARYEKRGQSVRILVAEDLSALRAGLREWHLLYGVLTLAVVALVLAVQQWVVRRSLAPLDTLRAQMQALERGERERLDVALPDEIAPLVDQFNTLLGMLLRRSQRSRDALGNLAHALKTRLAVLLQVAESPAMAAHPELQQRMTDSTELMRRAIERELRRARQIGRAHV